MSVYKVSVVDNELLTTETGNQFRFSRRQTANEAGNEREGFRFMIDQARSANLLVYHISLLLRRRFSFPFRVFEHVGGKKHTK